MKSKLSIVKTVVVFVIILLVGVFGVLGLSTAKTYLSGATAGLEPKNVMAQPGENEVTITWDTDVSSKGYIQYGTTPASLLLSVPSRDELQTEGGDTTHRISIKTFKPETNYYFRIRVGNDVAKYNEWEIFDNGGIPYSFKSKGMAVPTSSPVETLPVIPTPTAGQGSCNSGIDYNNDKIENVLDLIYCLQHNPLATVTETPTASTSASQEECEAGLDYNKDGIINSLDLIACRQGKGR